MRTWEIVLEGYDKPPLNQNQRYHWRKVHRLKKKLRLSTKLHIQNAGVPRLYGLVTVQLVWEVGDNRRRDRDNPMSSVKPCIDGMVDAGVVPDDSAELVTYKPVQIVNTGDKRLRFRITGEPSAALAAARKEVN